MRIIEAGTNYQKQNANLDDLQEFQDSEQEQEQQAQKLLEQITEDAFTNLVYKNQGKFETGLSTQAGQGQGWQGLDSTVLAFNDEAAKANPPAPYDLADDLNKHIFMEWETVPGEQVNVSEKYKGNPVALQIDIGQKFSFSLVNGDKGQKDLKMVWPNPKDSKLDPTTFTIDSKALDTKGFTVTRRPEGLPYFDDIYRAKIMPHEVKKFLEDPDNGVTEFKNVSAEDIVRAIESKIDPGKLSNKDTEFLLRHYHEGGSLGRVPSDYLISQKNVDALREKIIADTGIDVAVKDLRLGMNSNSQSYNLSSAIESNGFILARHGGENTELKYEKGEFRIANGDEFDHHSRGAAIKQIQGLLAKNPGHEKFQAGYNDYGTFVVLRDPKDKGKNRNHDALLYYAPAGKELKPITRAYVGANGHAEQSLGNEHKLDEKFGDVNILISSNNREGNIGSLYYRDIPVEEYSAKKPK